MGLGGQGPLTGMDAGKMAARPPEPAGGQSGGEQVFPRAQLEQRELVGWGFRPE